jgi:hypothetical protein
VSKRALAVLVVCAVSFFVPAPPPASAALESRCDSVGFSVSNCPLYFAGPALTVHGRVLNHPDVYVIIRLVDTSTDTLLLECRGIGSCDAATLTTLPTVVPASVEPPVERLQCYGNTLLDFDYEFGCSSRSI